MDYYDGNYQKIWSITLKIEKCVYKKSKSWQIHQKFVQFLKIIRLERAHTSTPLISIPANQTLIGTSKK